MRCISGSRKTGTESNSWSFSASDSRSSSSVAIPGQPIHTTRFRAVSDSAFFAVTAS